MAVNDGSANASAGSPQRPTLLDSYGALILDLKLPGLGGLDAIAVVKRFDGSLPIIVMTGHPSYDVEQAARAAGIFYYLVKPFNLDELVAAVRAAIRFRDSTRRKI